jgi:signal transduction histidine kinase
LMDMASIVADEIELRRGSASRVAEENQRYITCTAHDLRTPLQVFRLATEHFKTHFLREQQRQREAAGTGAEAVSSTRTNNIAASAATAASTHDSAEAEELTALLDVALQAEAACDMMDETVQNAIVTARARWSSSGSSSSSSRMDSSRMDASMMDDSVLGSGDLQQPRPLGAGGAALSSLALLSVRGLVDACRRLSSWHHDEAVHWTVEVAPEVGALKTQHAHMYNLGLLCCTALTTLTRTSQFFLGKFEG